MTHIIHQYWHRNTARLTIRITITRYFQVFNDEIAITNKIL